MGEVCKKCGQPVVHPARKYRLCLDCLIDIIAENTDTSFSQYEVPRRGLSPKALKAKKAATLYPEKCGSLWFDNSPFKYTLVDGGHHQCGRKKGHRGEHICDYCAIEAKAGVK